MRDIASALREHGIDLKVTAPGRYYITCPQCSAKRKGAHKNAKVLGVTVETDRAHWGCNHCGWTGATGKANGADRADPNLYYDYVDENGELLFQKVRGPNKKFWQRRPDGKGGWIKKLGDTRKVIYRLPQVNKAIAPAYTIVCVEGEKDADNLWKIGVPATCNPDGAAKPGQRPKWRREYSEMLRGADIVVIGDNDPAGRAHIEATAATSIGIASRVRVLDLPKHWPECPQGGDISDYLDTGHTREQFDTLIEQASDFHPGDFTERQPNNGGGRTDRDDGRQLPPPSRPMEVARVFVASRMHDGELTLRHWRGGWWEWRQSFWQETEDRAVKATLYSFTESAVYVGDDAKQTPWAPNRRKIADLAEALAAICHLSDRVDQPSWLAWPYEGHPSNVIVATANGLLDIERRELLSHTPLFFNQTAVPFGYDPQAPEPERWLGFLKQLWPNEPDAINVLVLLSQKATCEGI
jgi:hypothetical protein